MIGMKECNSKYCNCLYYSANALSRVMTKMADEEFAATGLSSSYAFLLMTVNDKPGVQPKEISEKMMLTQSTVTRLIEKMEHKGFLERKHSGRNTEVYPTAKSKKLDKKIKQAWMSLYKRYTAILGKEKSKKLTDDIYGAAIKLHE